MSPGTPLAPPFETAVGVNSDERAVEAFGHKPPAREAVRFLQWQIDPVDADAPDLHVPPHTTHGLRPPARRRCDTGPVALVNAIVAQGRGTSETGTAR